MSSHYQNRLKALRITDIEAPALLALIWAATKSPALERLVRHSHDTFNIRREESDHREAQRRRSPWAAVASAPSRKRRHVPR